MARFLSQSLILSQRIFPFYAPSHRLLTFRNRSNKSGKSQQSPQFIEVDLDSDGEIDVLGMRRLEDAIHGIIVRRSAPDWLPFLPGSSYWVPPLSRPLGVVELVGRLANPLSEEETLSLSTVRGWPSTSYFVEGASPHGPHPVKRKSKKKTSHSEDEEG